MNDISAAVGIHQLGRLDGWIERRAELADRYDEALRDLPLELPPRPPAHARHAHHLYIVRLHEGLRVSRDTVIERMQQQAIGCSVHFEAIHLYRLLQLPLRPVPRRPPRRRAPFGPRAEPAPVPAMSEADVEHVASTLASCWRSRADALPPARAAVRRPRPDRCAARRARAGRAQVDVGPGDAARRLLGVPDLQAARRPGAPAPASVAPRRAARPAHPRNPNDPAYHWHSSSTPSPWSRRNGSAAAL